MDYFKNSYKYQWENYENIGKIHQYNDARQPLKIGFATPELYCYGNTGNGWTKLFQMNVRTNVYRTETKRTKVLENGTYTVEEVSGTREFCASYDSASSGMIQMNNASCLVNGGQAYLRRIIFENNSEGKNDKPTNWTDFYTKSSLLAKTIAGVNYESISFDLPALTQEEIEAGKGYKYDIECLANPIKKDAMLSYYEASHNGRCEYPGLGLKTLYYWSVKTTREDLVDPSSIKLITTFYHKDMSVMEEGGPFLTKGEKYSCYQLLRKALLTCDTHVIDNNTASLDEYNKSGELMHSLSHAVILEESLNNRLRTAKVNETIFEGKNLWEILIQIGYYIHAIPFLKFANDGTDRLVLGFKQLGGTTKNEDIGTKISVFNSRNLSDFFTQYDSYVTNLFSPQNIVEEWVVPKTSDSTFLVSNNSAELQLTYPITEILELEISMCLPNEKRDTRSALKHIFEKSIYDILSNDNSYQVYPCKGSSIYHSLGSCKIQGLNFVPPSANSGDLPMALKRIIQILWQGIEINPIEKIKFNELKFHVKYRTQDSARVSQIRPDIQNFMKNSSYEKYPHHEQFYGQQDKIVDSERFSANLFGKLIRVGNNIFERQEYIPLGGVAKESGELVEIDGENYYVVSVENEFYTEAIFQKVTYSKNFNQLSNIVTIPSEPRFYEVSERSKIRREVRIMEFFELSTKKNTSALEPMFLNNSEWKSFLSSLIFNKTKVTLPNYAWTRFKADKKRFHHSCSGLEIPNNQLFPSSLLDRSEPTIRPESPADHVDCIVPLLHFPLHDAIVFEWDMNDNFKVGDFIDNHAYTSQLLNDDAYLSMQPLRYVDTLGRADLFSFKLFNKIDWEFEDARRLPQAVVNISESQSIAFLQGGDNMGIALDKDCREALSFNYQINLLHRASEDDDDFITFPNLFGQKSSPLKMCLLSEPQSMFNENISLSPAKVLADNLNYELILDANNAIEVRIPTPINVDMSQVKSIVLYQEDEIEGRYAYIVKNVAKLKNNKKLDSWWISSVFSPK